MGQQGSKAGKKGKDGKKTKGGPAIDPKSVKEFQTQTNFDKVEVRRLYDTFKDICKEKGWVNREQFKDGLGRLQEAGLENLDDSPFVERLFDLLDINKDGRVDLQEFITGLSLLCKGSPEEKLELSFKAYDLDNSGTISKEELAQMFKLAWLAGFKTLCSSHGQQELSDDDLEEFASEMAQLFADNAFTSLDTNNDGELSFEEFKEFALAEPKISATLNGFKQEVSVTLF